MTKALTLLVALALIACDKEPSPTAELPQKEMEVVEAIKPEAEAPPPNLKEACASAIVVSYKGAAHAAESISRTKDEARAKAESLRARLEKGEDFATVAKAESDASSSGPRGGMLGTYERGDWPSAHDLIRDPVFALKVNELSNVIEAHYGFVVAKRCPIEKVNSRHVLIRYAGAKNAKGRTTRKKAIALGLAEELQLALAAPNADFEAIAKERSEDSSATRGGNMGSVGRGRLAPEYEAALFALSDNEVSDVVETAFGFHIIQRLPD